jgi:hypothetical protein
MVYCPNHHNQKYNCQMTPEEWRALDTEVEERAKKGNDNNMKKR